MKYNEVDIGKAHERMISQLADYERDSELINEIYKVLGAETDDVLNKIDDLLKQFNVDTATWGLATWEKNLDIETREQLSLGERRARIKAKRKQQGKVSTVMLEQLVQDYFDKKVSVGFNGKLLFDIPFEGNTVNLMRLIEDMIYKTKPAHLGYDVSVYMEAGNPSLYMGSIGQSGEEITLYPKEIRDPEIYVPMFIGMSHAGIAETTTISGDNEEWQSIFKV